MRICAVLAVFPLFFTGVLSAQPYSNRTLQGKYYVRHVMMVPSGTGFSDLRSLGGAVTFDGSGNYTFAGTQTVGAGAPQEFTSSGTYSVAANGFATISSLLRAGAAVQARYSPWAVVGSSTETGGGAYDVFIAIPAPTQAVTMGEIAGSYWAAGVEYVNAATAISRATYFSFRGAGILPAFSVTGQASNLGRRAVTQTVSGASLTVNADGTGRANFPVAVGTSAALTLLGGQRDTWVSADRRILLFGTREAGSHDLIVAVRADTGVTLNSVRDLYFTAGIQLNGNRGNAHVGSANSAGQGALLTSRRVRAPEGVVDFTGVSRISLQSDGQGLEGVNRFAAGAGGTVFLSSGVSLVDADNYELTVGVKAGAYPASGTVFLSPYGVVNAANFAPAGNPVSPGGFLTLFGAGLAPSAAVAAGTPFPLALNGVQVLINGAQAPLYAVAPGQISAVVPYGTAVGPARVVVVNGANRSNEVEVRVAATAPGIFTIPPVGAGPGAILKTDFSLVTAQNPARRGETVLIYTAGLGMVTPAAADGAAAGANPLSTVIAPVNVYIGGVRAEVSFKGLAPGFAGLYQLNVRIPANAPGGPNVAVGIETPEAFHDQADIAIAP